MALFPIFIGSYRSVSSHKESKDKSVIVLNIKEMRNACVFQRVRICDKRFASNPTYVYGVAFL